MLYFILWIPVFSLTCYSHTFEEVSQVTEEHKMSPLIMEIHEEREINYFKALIVFKNYEHNTTLFN